MSARTDTVKVGDWAKLRDTGALWVVTAVGPNWVAVVAHASGTSCALTRDDYRAQFDAPGDYDRLEELRQLRKDFEPGDSDATWEGLCGDEAEELAELEKAAGECESREDAETRIQEDPLRALTDRLDRFGNPLWRCPCCGRFIKYDSDGYYDTAERGADPEHTHVACFCNEACADRFHGRAPVQS